ncbi:MAG: hypothetical protein ABSG75_11160 [Syntrophales bacterium]|jgi:hypothetical protein
MNGFITIKEKDWEGMDDKQKLWAIYNTLQTMDGRMKTLERRPITDKCFAFCGGIIGGFLAALGIKYGGH